LRTKGHRKNGVFWDVTPHGVTSQKTPFFIVTTVNTSNLTRAIEFVLFVSQYLTAETE
jgi:hypothetical protein